MKIKIYVESHYEMEVDDKFKVLTEEWHSDLAIELENLITNTPVKNMTPCADTKYLEGVYDMDNNPMIEY